MYHNGTWKAKYTLPLRSPRRNMVLAMARRFPLPAVLLLFLAAFAGCNGDVFDAECDLVVVNDSACDLTVFVDGREAFDLGAGSDRTLDDIGPGQHVIEALNVHGALVERRSIDLTASEDYYWIVSDC